MGRSLVAVATGAAGDNAVEHEDGISPFTGANVAP